MKASWGIDTLPYSRIPRFALLLLLEELAFAGGIATITFDRHVLISGGSAPSYLVRYLEFLEQLSGVRTEAPSSLRPSSVLVSAITKAGWSP